MMCTHTWVHLNEDVLIGYDLCGAKVSKDLFFT